MHLAPERFSEKTRCLLRRREADYGVDVIAS
jgi:hypothetical protein